MGITLYRWGEVTVRMRNVSMAGVNVRPRWGITLYGWDEVEVRMGTVSMARVNERL